jgi:hypothetical protein
MADALYALEKLADAADALENGAGSVHERLFEAFSDLVRIGPEDMPEPSARLPRELRLIIAPRRASGARKSPGRRQPARARSLDRPCRIGSDAGSLGRR